MKSSLLSITVLTMAMVGCGGGGGSGSAPTKPVDVIVTTSSSSISSSSSVTVSSSSSSSVVSSSLSSSSSSSSKRLDAIMTEKTSYLNKLKAGDPNHGKEYRMIANNVVDSFGLQRPLAYGDFFQDGTIAAFTTDYVDNSNPDANTHKAGTVHFFHSSASKDGWEDRTAELLTHVEGCIALKKVSVADFNGDSKPDLFLGCHGADVHPFPGEQQRVLLSQADGTYSNTQLALSCYCHGSAAGDINGDGIVDVVLMDVVVTEGRTQHPIALIGRGDGTFTEDNSRFPEAMIGEPIFTLDLIDAGRGVLDLFVGGVTPNATKGETWNGFENSIIQNNGLGQFTDRVILDNTPSATTGIFYVSALDFIVKDGFVYIDQNADGMNSSTIRKIDLRDPTQSTLLHEFVNNGLSNVWFAWLTMVEGKITSMCDYSPTEVSSWCTWEGIAI